jgi:hypothetical protein
MVSIAPGSKGKRKGKGGEKEMRRSNRRIQMLLIKNANFVMGNDNDSYCYICINKWIYPYRLGRDMIGNYKPWLMAR